MKLNKIIAGTSAVALTLSMTSNAFALTLGTGDPVAASESIDITVEVQDTLSLDCYDTTLGTGNTTVDLGGTVAGIVTAGSPAVGGSTCDVTTNDDQGYYLTMDNTSTAGTGEVLEHQDPHTGDWYSITEVGLTEWDWDEVTATGSATVDWDGTTPTGLGFSVMNVPEVDAVNNSLNAAWTGATTTGGACPSGTAADDNVYAGIPNTAEAITAVVAYSETQTTTDVCYKVDVTPVQQSGQYAGVITFTATTDASTYHN